VQYISRVNDVRGKVILILMLIRQFTKKNSKQQWKILCNWNSRYVDFDLKRVFSNFFYIYIQIVGLDLNSNDCLIWCFYASKVRIKQDSKFQHQTSSVLYLKGWYLYQKTLNFICAIKRIHFCDHFRIQSSVLQNWHVLSSHCILYMKRVHTLE